MGECSRDTSQYSGQDEFNNRVVDWIELLERMCIEVQQGKRGQTIAPLDLLVLRDLLALMNRERKNLRAAIEDSIDRNLPARSLDYALDWADSIEFGRH